MATKRRPYKTYPVEFKLEAIRMMEQSDRPAAEIARELGLRRNQLYKWREQLQINRVGVIDFGISKRHRNQRQNRDHPSFKG